MCHIKDVWFIPKLWHATTTNAFTALVIAKSVALRMLTVLVPTTPKNSHNSKQFTHPSSISRPHFTVIEVCVSVFS
jgi:hypothetical protein